MAIFEGAGVAIVTPMKANGEINYDKFEELIEEQIAGGTDCIIAVGTTGEASTLTEKEHIDAIRFAVEVTKHRIPVIGGTGSNSTASMIQYSTEAEEAGVDGLLLVSPYYNKTSQRGLIASFKATADAVKVPALLYNVPSRTGINIAPETIAWLCKNVDNIVGVKEASGNFSNIARLMSIADGKVDLYSGNDDQTVPMLAIGGKGVISVLSNVAPRQTHDMCQAFFDGDVAKAQKMQLEAIPLIEALFCETNPIPVKEALNMMGKEVGGYRLPLVEMAPENRERLRAEMRNYGLID
ncbi:MAG: 4-hydroxy-tetrahydrodipicolinate synthase [Clostridium sp.]|nr:4-hydroxy-tetrahydrodipicolinate synthase [Clostridium sp.]MBO6150168.1 4-hydroxy-tetrahydrodipicolinate synthase [Clostridium sp.]